MPSEFNDYRIDHKMTDYIGQPGLTIVDYPDENEDGVFYGQYIPTVPVICDKHHVMGQKNDFAPATGVYDYVPKGNTGRVVLIYIEWQRYRCPFCNADITYDPEYGKNGRSTTHRMNAFVSRLCLDKSSRRVAAQLNNCLSKSTIEEIFADWSKERLADYTKNLVPPEALGLHYVRTGKDEFLMLTDLDEQYIVDIFPWNARTPTSLQMMKIAAFGRTLNVLSDVEPGCMLLARGTFSSSHTQLRAAACSIFRTFTDTILSHLEEFPTSGKKQIKEYLTTPLWMEVTDLLQDKTVVKALNTLQDQSPDKRKWISNQNRLRHMLISSEWILTDYRVWKADISRHAEFSEFVSMLDIEEEEIDGSFTEPDLQNSYVGVHDDAVDLIERSKRCSFEILRSRLLLSFNPELTEIRSGSSTRYYYAGASIAKLKQSLPVYEP